MTIKSKTIAKTFSIAAIASFTFFAVASGDKKSSSESSSAKPTEQATISAVAVGQILKTDYFDITVNKVSVKDKVNTGNQFSDLKKEASNKYLIINATFKNTDKESRMVMEGSVWINYNGKEYEFDKSEAIMAEGYGTMLDQLNPLTSKTTNLVYKLPAEISGIGYWQPGRSNNDQKINLGDLK